MGDSGTPSASTKPDTPAYPPLPRVPDLTKPPAVCVAWVDAAEHEEAIDTLLNFGAWFWHWPAVGELTTGADVYDITNHDAETCTICAPLIGPLFTRRPERRCTCTYVKHPTRIALPATTSRVRHRTVIVATAFQIDEGCPHHGYAASFPAWSLWESVLDEDERRGH